MGFSKLAAQKVVDKTVRLVLNQLVGDPVLVVRYLGESNAEYFNDLLAKANTGHFLAARSGRTQVTPEAIREMRDRNRETVAKYAVVGVDNLRHDDGRDAVAEDVPAIVASLPDDVFDTVLAFVTNPDNFRTRVESDAAATAGK